MFLSLLILGLTAYFAFVLAKKIDFLIFASAAIPYTLYGFFASMYLFLASKFQAIITGEISIDGSPGRYTAVFLYHVHDQSGQKMRKLLKRKESGKDGLYTFYVWQKSGTYRHEVVAKGAFTDEQSTGEFNVSRGARVTLLRVNLTSQIKPQPAAEHH